MDDLDEDEDEDEVEDEDDGNPRVKRAKLEQAPSAYPHLS